MRITGDLGFMSRRTDAEDALACSFVVTGHNPKGLQTLRSASNASPAAGGCDGELTAEVLCRNYFKTEPGVAL
jgi:hypothetical protein